MSDVRYPTSDRLHAASPDVPTIATGVPTDISVDQRDRHAVRQAQLAGAVVAVGGDVSRYIVRLGNHPYDDAFEGLPFDPR